MADLANWTAEMFVLLASCFLGGASFAAGCWGGIQLATRWFGPIQVDHFYRSSLEQESERDD